MWISIHRDVTFIIERNRWGGNTVIKLTVLRIMITTTSIRKLGRDSYEFGLYQIRAILIKNDLLDYAKGFAYFHGKQVKTLRDYRKINWK